MSTERTDADRARRVAQLVDALTLEERASLTAGVDMWTTAGVPRLGVPPVRMTDGPSGARGRYWGAAATRAVAFPTGSALGATWDPELIHDVGEELGREALARGARILLGPTVNPQRAPLAGRTFECFTEDPLLSGILGAAYVRGVQSQGVAATVKHLAGNEAEWQRNSVDSIIDERTLREVYLLPFEWCVRAGAHAVMTAYNRLNGDHCPNEAWLLRDVLRGEWGFDGIVMTDWWGIVDTARAAHAGLDLEMPGPSRAFGPSLAAAVADGTVPEAELDAIVTRLLTTFDRVGVLDAIETVTTETGADEERCRDDEHTRRFARRVATSSMVLVKNEHRVLPLEMGDVRRIAVVGPNAAVARIMGGGSSQVRAAHRTPPLLAMAARWPEVEIVHASGVPGSLDPSPLEPWELETASGDPGFLVEYFATTDLTGAPVAVHAGDDFRIQYLGAPGEGIPYPHFSARAAATFRASVAGRHEFVLRSNARARLIADGVEVSTFDVGEDLDWVGAIHELRWSVDLDEGERVHLAVEFVNPEFATYGRTSLSCVRPSRPDELARAIDAARDADAAIVVVGTSDLIESEGYDRTTLSLPAGCDELVERVAEVNPRTVVVVNSGGPVAMPWLARVPAVLQAWFAGQELGDALVDVLEGVAEPSGRMPFTVPHRIEDTPSFGSFPGEAGAVRYAEGVLIGHRWYDTRRIDVAVPFGHGGSYTRFEWGAPQVTAAGTSVSISLPVTNTGGRAGVEVVQVYVEPPADSPVFRARRELKGFARLSLAPAERAVARIDLDDRAFAHWSPVDTASAHHDVVRTTPFAATVPVSVPPVGWTVHAGEYRLHIARSVLDVHAVVPVDIGR